MHYTGHFSSCFPVAFSQLIETVATFVLQLSTDKLEVSSLEFYASTFYVPFSSLREATVEVFLLFSKRILIAVSFKWFGQYITTEMDTLHDCYVAKCEEFNKEMKHFGFLYENDSQSCRNSNNIQPQDWCELLQTSSIIFNSVYVAIMK